MTLEEKREFLNDFCSTKDKCEECKLEHVSDECEFDYDTEDVLDKCIAVLNDDPVNHPSHYCQGGIGCFDAMTAAFGKTAIMNFCICNAFKYVFRHQHKNGIQDIEKAIWYLNKFKELSDANDANEVNEDGASEKI